MEDQNYTSLAVGQKKNNANADFKAEHAWKRKIEEQFRGTIVSDQWKSWSIPCIEKEQKTNKQLNK